MVAKLVFESFQDKIEKTQRPDLYKLCGLFAQRLHEAYVERGKSSDIYQESFAQLTPLFLSRYVQHPHNGEVWTQEFISELTAESISKIALPSLTNSYKEIGVVNSQKNVALDVLNCAPEFFDAQVYGELFDYIRNINKVPLGNYIIDSFALIPSTIVMRHETLKPK